MTAIRPVLAVALLLLVTCAPAAAGLARQCRKRCKPDIVECVQLTGQPKRVCRKTMIRVCKGLGLDACGHGAPPDDGGPTTTTTTMPSSPGRVDIEIQDIERDASTDPGVYSFVVTFQSDADSVALGLDPALFVVIDQRSTRHAASPASVDPDDCSASLILPPGGEVTCTLRFVLPLTTGADA
ncbi:MAG TPA: hypothetical protein VGR62_02400, partial [Candidatus Binatia bacterium]|nr:hypothetical protein [Candidatus Binatia bacterium]